MGNADRVSDNGEFKQKGGMYAYREAVEGVADAYADSARV